MSNYKDINLPKNSTFKNFAVDEYISIPNDNHDIYKIISFKAKITSSKIKVTKPNYGSSFVDGKVCNYKLIVDGEMRTKIEYIYDIETKSVATTFLNIPFSTYLELPNSYNPNTSIRLKVYFENIYCEAVDFHTIYTNAIILLVAEF